MTKDTKPAPTHKREFNLDLHNLRMAPIKDRLNRIEALLNHAVWDTCNLLTNGPSSSIIVIEPDEFLLKQAADEFEALTDALRRLRDRVTRREEWQLDNLAKQKGRRGS